MKITKRQLRRIIKEEKQKLVNEGTEFHGSHGAVGDLEGLVKQVMGIFSSMDPMERNPEIYRLIDELEDLASRG